MPVCSIDGCDWPSQTRMEGATCERHYQKMWRGADPESLGVRPYKACWVTGCPRVADTKGLCKPHVKSVKLGRMQVPESLGVTVNPMCGFDGCKNRMVSIRRGLCHSHYCQTQRGEELSPLRVYGDYVDGSIGCLVPACRRPAQTARGLCATHRSSASTYNLSTEELIGWRSVEMCQNPGCTSTERLHIDHDHDTGVVRGILCGGCNVALGLLGEDVARIRALAEYISRF